MSRLDDEAEVVIQVTQAEQFLDRLMELVKGVVGEWDRQYSRDLKIMRLAASLFTQNEPEQLAVLVSLLVFQRLEAAG